ncbi:uncharacterized protein LOC62_06G007844 [Vanrija pseudolonga]|uniref:Uncharacterized protein n=1 Tax=Vanrija pseudolonga TaxID=143232 RepID=A0AAF0YCR5_9TREE|nr:hypothetical protein LOC62_06G007844 [Vanrija pseudolonga]
MSLLNTVHAHMDSLGLPRVTHMFGTPPPSPGEPKTAPPPPAAASYPSSPYLSSPSPAPTAAARSPSPRLPAPVTATHAPTGLARFSTRLTTRWAILALCALALLTLVHFLLFIDGAPLAAGQAVPDADVRNFKAARLGQLGGAAKVAPNGWVGPMRGGLPIHARVGAPAAAGAQ